VPLKEDPQDVIAANRHTLTITSHTRLDIIFVRSLFCIYSLQNSIAKQNHYGLVMQDDTAAIWVYDIKIAAGDKFDFL
jgi:hypothetical protein